MKEKMIRTAGKLDIFASVAEKMLLVCGILISVLTIIAAVMTAAGSDFFVVNSADIQLGGVTLVLAEDALPSDFFRAVYAVGGLLAAAVILFVACYVVKIIRNILSPMKAGRPFENQCSVNLRLLAIIAWIAGGVWEIGRNVATYFLLEQISLDSILNMEKLSELQYDYGIDISFIIYGAILLLLSYVFQYGEVLQRESDETL